MAEIIPVICNFRSVRVSTSSRCRITVMLGRWIYRSSRTRRKKRHTSGLFCMSGGMRCSGTAYRTCSRGQGGSQTRGLRPADVHLPRGSIEWPTCSDGTAEELTDRRDWTLVAVAVRPERSPRQSCRTRCTVVSDSITCRILYGV